MTPVKYHLTSEPRVVSFEIAKRLKDLGVEQESFWVWVYFQPDRREDGKWELRKFSDSYNFKDSRISAFTVGELGDILRQKPDFYIPYLDMKNQGWISPASNKPDTEENARGLALISLLENSSAGERRVG